MRRTRWVAGALLATVLAGCAGGAVIKPPSITATAKFCTDVAAFATKASALNDAASQTREQLLQVLPGIVSDLKALQQEAPAPDTVNGKPLKGDIGTIAGIYQDLVTQLQETSDVHAALDAVNKKSGQALTDAVGRFDDYASSVCKVGQGVPALPSSTTGAPSAPTTAVGPTSPTT